MICLLTLPVSVSARTILLGAHTVEDPYSGSVRHVDALQQQIKAMALTLHGDLEQATEAWQKALERTPSGSDALPREMLAQVLVARGKSNEASELVKPGWPLLTPDQMLLFDSLVYPNLFFVRGAVAQQASNNAAKTADSRCVRDRFTMLPLRPAWRRLADRPRTDSRAATQSGCASAAPDRPRSWCAAG